MEQCLAYISEEHGRLLIVTLVVLDYRCLKQVLVSGGEWW